MNEADEKYKLLMKQIDSLEIAAWQCMNQLKQLRHDIDKLEVDKLVKCREWWLQREVREFGIRQAHTIEQISIPLREPMPEQIRVIEPLPYDVLIKEIHTLRAGYGQEGMMEMTKEIVHKLYDLGMVRHDK